MGKSVTYLFIGPSDRTKIEGWDCTFAMDWQVIPQSNNNQSAGNTILNDVFIFLLNHDHSNGCVYLSIKP